jgi:hypothetical protein
MSKKFEVSGFVIKEETVNSLTHSIMPGTFVLEINHPFPGYYGQAMMEYSKPRSVLLLTKKAHSWESVLRTSAKLKKYLELDFNASSSVMYVGSKSYPCIRIKGLDSFEAIKTIQNAFSDEGFIFRRAPRKYTDETVLIKVKKFYCLKETADGIYADMNQKEVSYALIPSRLNWELFRKITLRIKNNISDRTYDVALVTLYRNGGIQDALRIFKPNHTPELLEEIRKMYLEEIARYE